MIYDIDYFLQKFGHVPSKKMIEMEIDNGGDKCANGWCGVSKEDYKGTAESHFLEKALEPLTLHWFAPNNHLVHGKPFSYLPVPDHMYVYSNRAEVINDGITQEYQQRTPKQRILAALRDVKKMQEDQQVKPEEKEVIIKHKITYVVIPESVSKEMKKQTEEIVLS